MYQPQISVKTQKMVGVEALIRWNDKGKLVMPNEFLAHAEDLGVMTQISQWVLNEACMQTKKWQVSGLDVPKVAVNLPVSSIMHPHIIKYIKHALKSSKLAPSCLEIEITETNFISSTDYTISVLRELRALGIRVSIDDFGTGYSCMSYLQNLPIDTLKIDGSFVSNLGKNKAANGIVQSIVTLGKSLNLNLIAECAETQEQVNALEMLECDVIQGYFFSRPLSSEQVVSYLKKA
jgi:EAL domain-containing protein (putative c-di-GMP-specific phosphodiesterase class I)